MYNKFLNLILAMAMIFSLGASVYADNPPADEEKNVFDILNRADSGVAARQVEKEKTYIITNPDIIAELSDSEDLPDEIELTYIPAEDDSAETTHSARIFDSYKLKNVRDKLERVVKLLLTYIKTMGR